MQATSRGTVFLGERAGEDGVGDLLGAREREVGRGEHASGVAGAQLTSPASQVVSAPLGKAASSASGLAIGNEAPASAPTSWLLSSLLTSMVASYDAFPPAAP